jgi:hypothetical protein
MPVDPAARHLAQIRATTAQLGRWAVISHVSAAVLHGWQPWAIPLNQVRVTRDKRSGGRSNGGLHVRTAPLDSDEIVLMDGIATTSPARTVVDVARTVPLEQAVVIADQALASAGVTAEELDVALRRATGWQGVPGARRTVEFADGASANVGESRSRVAIARARLPAPTLQWRICTPRGDHIGTTDFGWPPQRTVGEFDGMVKYGRCVPPGRTAADVVVAEKLREDALRAEGLGVVRWTWQDLSCFEPVALRLRQQLER